MNTFVQRLLDAGFTEQSRKRIWGDQLPKHVEPFKSSAGWLGVTKQHPYAELKKGNKTVVISLGYSTKIISFYIGRYCAYNTMFGIMPPETVVNYFIRHSENTGKEYSIKETFT